MIGKVFQPRTPVDEIDIVMIQMIVRSREVRQAARRNDVADADDAWGREKGALGW